MENLIFFAVRNAQKLNSRIPRLNQITFDSNSFKSFGPELRDLLCYHLKTSKNLITFEEIIESWNGVSCGCRICHA